MIFVIRQHILKVSNSSNTNQTKWIQNPSGGISILLKVLNLLIVYDEYQNGRIQFQYENIFNLNQNYRVAVHLPFFLLLASTVRESTL